MDLSASAQPPSLPSFPIPGAPRPPFPRLKALTHTPHAFGACLPRLHGMHHCITASLHHCITASLHHDSRGLGPGRPAKVARLSRLSRDTHDNHNSRDSRMNFPPSQEPPRHRGRHEGGAWKFLPSVSLGNSRLRCMSWLPWPPATVAVAGHRRRGFGESVTPEKYPWKGPAGPGQACARGAGITGVIAGRTVITAAMAALSSLHCRMPSWNDMSLRGVPMALRSGNEMSQQIPQRRVTAIPQMKRHCGPSLQGPIPQ
jgi:hypothetical protein